MNRRRGRWYEVNQKWLRYPHMIVEPQGGEAVLVEATDQAPTDFKAHLQLILHGLRYMWLPGPDHREHNITENMFVLTGTVPVKQTSQWLSSGCLKGP